MSFIVNFSPDQERLAGFARLAAEEVNGVRNPSEEAVAGVAEELIRDKDVIVLTDNRGELLSAASYWVDSRDCVLDTLVSNPEHRGRGFGRLALNLVEATARHMGAESVELHSLDSANEFYELMGYETVMDEDRPVTHAKSL